MRWDDSSQNCGFNDWEINVVVETFEAYTKYDEVPGASFKADVVTIGGISYYP